MRALLLEPDPKWLEERRRLGHDRRDEVWDGVLHVVPSPTTTHQRFERELERILAPIVEALGFEIFHELDVLDRTKGELDYREIDVYVLHGGSYAPVAPQGSREIVAPRFGLTLQVIDGPKLRISWSGGSAEI